MVQPLIPAGNTALRRFAMPVASTLPPSRCADRRRRPAALPHLRHHLRHPGGSGPPALTPAGHAVQGRTLRQAGGVPLPGEGLLREDTTQGGGEVGGIMHVGGKGTKSGSIFKDKISCCCSINDSIVNRILQLFRTMF